MSQNAIRNFAIIAHIDHGKSTLADRFLEITGTISAREARDQYLDSNPISRERGITIKLAPVRMLWHPQALNSKHEFLSKSQIQNSNNKNNFKFAGSEYILNLIDTPGHVDFSYEVTRTLYACEGAVLLVDATKGVQAQTVAHYNTAKKLNLKIIPVLNKIDLDSAEVERVTKEIQESFGFAKEEIMKISAKKGFGVEALLEKIIEDVPPPSGNEKNPTQALIFDSKYDDHRGIVIFARIKNGSIRKGDEVIFLSDGLKIQVLDVGVMAPTFLSTEALSTGEVGYIITNIKDITQAKVGDTITSAENPGGILPGYEVQKQFVFFSVYPSSGSEYGALRKALHSIRLTDAALVFTTDHSSIFGAGFRCGFLGLLHAQVVTERLEKEYTLDVFTAPPSIPYLVDGKLITSPKDFDNGADDIKEPYIIGEIYVPQEYLGAILEIIHQLRGYKSDIGYFSTQAKIVFQMPLASIVYDFYDKIKSVSRGYASFDYEVLDDFQTADLVRVDISVNDKIVPELSFITHKDQAYPFARSITKVLSESIPKHQFVINVRAQIGTRIIASEKISALSKNVTAKLYGGDRTRKDKLLDKQKKGKAKMKQIGNVNVPKEAFLSVLKV